MSMARCDECQVLIDTDIEPEACVEGGFLCEVCRTLMDGEAAFEVTNAYEPNRDF